jgi:hypothetical protein
MLTIENCHKLKLFTINAKERCKTLIYECPKNKVVNVYVKRTRLLGEHPFCCHLKF